MIAKRCLCTSIQKATTAELKEHIASELWELVGDTMVRPVFPPPFIAKWTNDVPSQNRLFLS